MADMSLDVLADTVLREHAISAVERYFEEFTDAKRPVPVKRSQIEGLRQIAANQPGRLEDFAKKQREKAHKRFHTNEAEFWNLVLRLIGRAGAGMQAWSIPDAMELPGHLQVPSKPQSGASMIELQANNEAKKKLNAWREERMAELAPVFFQRFCAHYLYKMALRESQRGGRKHDDDHDALDD